MSTTKKLTPAIAGLLTFLLPLIAQAQEAAGGSAANGSSVKMYAALGAGLAIGLGVIGGTLAQGRASAAALEGISRNPGAAARIQTPMILGLALIESLVLLAFVIAFFLQGIAAK